jgi:hypothetical protein
VTATDPPDESVVHGTTKHNIEKMKVKFVVGQNDQKGKNDQMESAPSQISSRRPVEVKIEN